MRKRFVLVPVEVHIDDDNEYLTHINPSTRDIWDAQDACSLTFINQQAALDVLFDIEEDDDD